MTNEPGVASNWVSSSPGDGCLTQARQLLDSHTDDPCSSYLATQSRPRQATNVSISKTADRGAREGTMPPDAHPAELPQADVAKMRPAIPPSDRSIPQGHDRDPHCRASTFQQTTMLARGSRADRRRTGRCPWCGRHCSDISTGDPRRPPSRAVCSPGESRDLQRRDEVPLRQSACRPSRDGQAARKAPSVPEVRIIVRRHARWSGALAHGADADRVVSDLQP